MIIKRIFTIILPLSVILLIVWVFRFWFSPDVISSGDFGYLSNNAIDRLYIYPYLWNTSFGSGLGGNITYILALNTFYYASALLLHNIFRFGWEVIERIVWFWPFLLISVLTSTYLFKKMFPQNNFWIFSSLIFLFNTYTLMLVSGGQMGVAMAYAVAPLVLAQFIRLVNNATFRRAIVTGLTLSLLILFDPRIAYVVLLGVLLYWVIAMIFEKTVSIRKVFFLGIPIVIAGLIHAFWILPLLWFQVNPIESLGSAYNSLVSVKFFSFADFSHALSLLHPNWPENLFGKVYFLQPEFLIIPILAFSSLLFIKPKSDNRRPASPAGGPVIFFALLAIVGIFLSKGANPPAGGIYLWLFAHVPGFNVFRDPTKFYLLTAIAYSMLIPVALDRIGKKVLIIVFVLFWLFTIRQA
ncbi:MAG: hypothetical protein NT162_02430, partial [Candidatus Woesebacteria bacterium]|nr:hypothetical protein [Candidatus Woesebacteria bacterium]